MPNITVHLLQICLIKDAKMMNCKIFLGLSGGVDSSVSALLLREAGYEVHGVMLLLKPPSEQREREAAQAQNTANELGIPLHFLDAVQLFHDTVINNFISEYKIGHTPNPCVLCNPTVKFAALLSFAASMGGGKIATGHYVEKIRLPDGTAALRRHKSRKDQSYFLCRLTEAQLEAAEFPLAPYHKEEVRAIAAEHGLPCASQSDSQEICFIPDGDYGTFLTETGGLQAQPGHFIDKNGKILGQHRGIIHYTLGQRRGLEIALGERMYVSNLNPTDNTVTLCTEQERYQTGLFVRDLHMIHGDTPREAFSADVKVRSTAAPVPAQITPQADGTCRITLSKKQTAAAPGQTAAFYRDDILLGGATIL